MLFFFFFFCSCATLQAAQHRFTWSTLKGIFLKVLPWRWQRWGCKVSHTHETPQIVQSQNCHCIELLCCIFNIFRPPWKKFQITSLNLCGRSSILRTSLTSRVCGGWRVCDGIILRRDWTSWTTAQMFLYYYYWRLICYSNSCCHVFLFQ